jgi:predicted AlkP superfamily phosphohydrolase/phosphomutase
MDSVVGRLVDAAGTGATVIVMSDHGSGPLWRNVHLDNWLLEQGYMQLKQGLKAQFRFFLLKRGLTISGVLAFLKRVGVWRWVRRLVDRETRFKLTSRAFGSAAVDWAQTLAYPVGIVGAVNINLAGREPEGKVARGAEYDETRRRVRAGLLELRDPDTDQPLVSKVLFGEEVYSGPCVADAPDLLVVWRNHAYRSTFILGNSNQLVSPYLTTFSGFHTMSGMLTLKGPRVRSGVRLDGARIIDIAPTILALLGLPIPGQMDGQALESALDESVAINIESNASKQLTGSDESLTSDEEAMITERLQGLGYI